MHYLVVYFQTGRSKDAESREEKTGMPYAEEYSFLCGRSGKSAWNYDARVRI